MQALVKIIVYPTVRGKSWVRATRHVEVANKAELVDGLQDIVTELTDEVINKVLKFHSQWEEVSQAEYQAMHRIDPVSPVVTATRRGIAAR